ncbi:hypothetical protein AB0C59_33470 [Streptomyces sp. NPDC048664]|uniref:hypothetical protein n=1 Tax=Streptomyces sp. NPDC048664 TaxID=3154505 RepID=UPI003441420C
MSHAPPAPRTAHRCAAWLRVLVALVALLTAGAHPEARADDTAALCASQSAGETAAEYEALATAPDAARPRGRAPAPRPPYTRAGSGLGPTGPRTAPRLPARTSRTPASRAPRTVVLRC